ncbi:protein BREAST CANCER SUSCEPTIBILITY 1 homolog [Panicum virgatum]|nr:protein BREAST CANCER SUSCEPTIBILITY 1 homolog [Panicum virgatum]
MADVGSLEKMGRELKCPICLSLLSSAVSITCNHIFCNGCLTESMKSSSSCPVCKVPFRRREIRPAPHMDNLVAVFKSMEAAAGTSVVSTQLAPAPKVADGSQCCGNSGSKAKRSRKKKVASKKENNTSKATAASASCPTTKPSISTNKRIHVTPFPESETPTRPKKIMKPEEQKTKLNGDAEEDKNKTLNSDRPESPSLSPFFWLRGEEEEEGGTAGTSSEPLSLETPLRHNAPTFSDLIDSDEETPNNATPNSKAEVSEIFDSEMFEWSQRPCSPELRSTPLKKQGKSKNVLDQITETDDVDDMNLGCSFDKLDHESNANAARPDNSKEIKNRKLARARTNKNSKLPNCVKLFTKRSDAANQDTDMPVTIDAKRCKKNSSKKERNTSSGGNKVSGNSSRFLCSSDKSAETSSPQDDGLEVEAPEDQPSERSSKIDKNSRRKLEITGDSAVKIAEKTSEQRSKRLRRISDGVVADKTRVFSEAENETEPLQLLSLIKGRSQHKSLDGRSKQSAESNIGPHTPSILPGRCLFNETIRTVPSVKNGSAKAIEQTGYSGTIRSCTARSAVLKKCEDKVPKISCAFCQSDDITEVSGEMVHYHNGKQVCTEFCGGASVIHSHKNCLEWAPDVYFKDDSVFNLATELARSRRIKCACCGIKGAALGCFEMSCRKSFHFTCAKLIPECRWDNENFVMLCPLHQSSKLPIETELKKMSQRRQSPKGPSQARPCQDSGNKWTWPSGSPQKWVLCCSALSAAEKGIVSEFAKIAGVPISTSWNPSVTHVIAKTDLSGACKRTLKFLMAILNGKWVLSIDWVKTCMERMEPVDEVRFEVTTDVHGVREGPKLGRQRVINKQPKLFDGIQLYLHGDYTKSYRGYLQDLVVAAGGNVLQRKPVSRDQQKLVDNSSLILIVYSVENQDRVKPKSKDDVDTGCNQADAQALACASGGRVVSSAWIIDSIAACNLQPL